MPRSLLLAGLLTACAAPPSDAALKDPLRGPSTARLAEGTATVQGMLAFLNDASTTFTLLDVDVGLDSRAARAIVAWRDGVDGVLGTADDRPFATLAQVDDRYYVGVSALARIQTWAEDHDWVPTDPDDLLGTWDSVSFTVAEADAVLNLVNSADTSTLDVDLGLDARAARSIVAAQPIDTVYTLSNLYYVGTRALEILKEAAAEVAESCDAPGWETLYVYDEGDGAWVDEVPAGFAAVVDAVLETDDWCGEATGEPWFVKATIDRYDCADVGYTIELGQEMLEYPGVVWYIEFVVDPSFDYELSACEV